MRLPLIIFVLLLGSGLFFYVTSGTVPEEDDHELSVPDEVYFSEDMHLLFTNAVLSVPEEDQSVDLEEGFGTIVHGSGATERTVVQVAAEAYSREHGIISAVLALNTGGSGTFYWLVLYEVQRAGAFVKLDEMFLGDRILVNYLRIENDVLHVSFNTHGSEQAFAERPNTEVVSRYMIADKHLRSVVSE